MQKPMVTILHAIPGRLRFSLSCHPQKVDGFTQGILEHPGINLVQYSPITKSLVITYRQELIQPAEIVIRVVTSLSLEHNFAPVQLSSKLKPKGLGVLDKYSGLALLAAWGVKFLGCHLNIQKIFLWNGVLSTIISILGHAWMEAKKRGIYDPEVLSLVYLINSIFKKNLLFATSLTWVTAFGRHIWEAADDKAEANQLPLPQMLSALLNFLSKTMDLGAKCSGNANRMGRWGVPLTV